MRWITLIALACIQMHALIVMAGSPATTLSQAQKYANEQSVNVFAGLDGALSGGNPAPAKTLSDSDEQKERMIENLLGVNVSEVDTPEEKAALAAKFAALMASLFPSNTGSKSNDTCTSKILTSLIYTNDRNTNNFSIEHSKL